MSTAKKVQRALEANRLAVADRITTRAADKAAKVKSRETRRLYLVAVDEYARNRAKADPRLRLIVRGPAS